MNCLITKQGRIVDCNGGQHNAVCLSKLHVNLNEFLLKRGGVRIMAGRTEQIAIEYHTHKPSDIQLRIVNKVLRQGNYYTVILVEKVIRKFRPIRGLGL